MKPLVDLQRTHSYSRGYYTINAVVFLEEGQALELGLGIRSYVETISRTISTPKWWQFWLAPTVVETRIERSDPVDKSLLRHEIVRY